MDFLDILRDGHETRDRTERLAHEVGVKACHDDSFTLVCKCLRYFDEVFAEELGLVNADDLCLIRTFKHLCRVLYRGAWDAVEVMGNDVHVRISLVNSRLEYLYFLVGELCSFQSSNEFLGLA